jgi:hypothetical protein
MTHSYPPAAYHFEFLGKPHHKDYVFGKHGNNVPEWRVLQSYQLSVYPGGVDPRCIALVQQLTADLPRNGSHTKPNIQFEAALPGADKKVDYVMKGDIQFLGGTPIEGSQTLAPILKTGIAQKLYPPKDVYFETEIEHWGVPHLIKLNVRRLDGRPTETLRSYDLGVKKKNDGSIWLQTQTTETADEVGRYEMDLEVHFMGEAWNIDWPPI